MDASFSFCYGKHQQLTFLFGSLVLVGVKEKKDAEENNIDSEEEHDKERDEEHNKEHDIEEHQVVEEVKTPTKMPIPAKQQQVPQQTRAAGAYKYKDDEKRWDAVHQSSKFISKGYIRDELIIEPPACFDGTEGTYQVGFDNDNQVLVVKIAPNPVFYDPHTINSYYANMYGVMTSDDSARNQAFKASARRIADKWYTFRYQLDWPGKPSEDLGMVPWIDYAEFMAEGRLYPLLIINLSSIKPVEEEKVKKMTGALKKKAFVSPAKVTGVNMAGDKTAQMAALLEDMIKSGQMSAEMKKAVRKFAGSADDMDESGDGTNKRPKAGYGSATVGSSDFL